MDKEAVWSSLDNDLQRLGLTQRGHLICLKAFVMPSTDKSKQTLTQSIKNAGATRVSRHSKKNRTVYLGWTHYDKKKSKYLSVRGSSSGICKHKFTSDTDKTQIFKKATSIFFKN